MAYADYVILVSHGITSAEAASNMQNLLQLVETQAADNLIAINIGKCFNMVISRINASGLMLITANVMFFWEVRR